MVFNKKTLVSLLMLGVVVSIASAGTWAYFDSSQTVADNQITSGKMGLNVINLYYNYEPVLVPMEAENAIPGHTDARLTPIPAYVRNTGSIDGVLTLKIVPNVDDDGILAKNLVIKATTSPIAGEAPMVTLWDGASTGSQEIRDLDVSQSEYIYYVYTFPDTGEPQNELQGKIFKFDVEYSLTQKQE